MEGDNYFLRVLQRLFQYLGWGLDLRGTIQKESLHLVVNGCLVSTHNSSLTCGSKIRLCAVWTCQKKARIS